MAKRINNGLASDLSSVMDEMAKASKGFSLADAAKQAHNIADVPSQSGVERTILLHLWNCGVAAKASKKPFGVAEAKAVVKAFNDHYYRDQGALTRAMPAKLTMDSKREACVKFFTVGKEHKDSASMVARTLAERNMNMSKRGTKILSLAEKFKDGAPSTDDLEAAFVPRKVDPKAYDWRGDLRGFCKSVQRRMDRKDFDQLQDAIQSNKAKREAIIFAQMQRLAIELRGLVENETDKNRKERATLAAAVAKLPTTNVVPLRQKAA